MQAGARPFCCVCVPIPTAQQIDVFDVLFFILCGKHKVVYLLFELHRHYVKSFLHLNRKDALLEAVAIQNGSD